MRARLIRGLKRLARQVRGGGPVILMYHRVASPRLDPWELAVSPERFDEQVAALKARRVVLPMSEFAELFAKGKLPAKAVGITFDDGYADNLINAAPILKSHEALATLFLCTGGVDRPRPYWSDELADLILLRRAAIDETVDIVGQAYRLTLPATEGPSSPWKAMGGPRTAHEKTYLELWSLLRDVDAEPREGALATLRSLAESPGGSEPPMTSDQVRAIARSGAFEIGGHTVSHPRLSQLDEAGQRLEIAAGKRACENLTGAPISGFAYPYGDFDARARDAVREAGFRWACTTQAGAVRSKCDIYTLPRLQAYDWPAQTLIGALDAA